VLGIFNQIPQLKKSFNLHIVFVGNVFTLFQLLFLFLTVLMLLLEGIYWYHDHFYMAN